MKTTKTTKATKATKAKAVGACILFLASMAGCGEDSSTGGDGGGPGDGGEDAGAGACTTTPSRDGDLALTDEGALRGTTAGETVTWKGIAYAAPPVGDLRFRPPEARGCVAEERAALDFGAICPQVDDDGNAIGDEDCLTLNVWTPAAASSPRPILFFIHGGGNVQGSASQLLNGAVLYDGEGLATENDVVVVTVQYRLGPLGYLTHPALADASGAAGNYGLMDQILALQWIRRNAAAFGGDPAHLLVFGESGGAVDTCALLTSPRAAGLFSAALMESGGCVARTRSVAETEGATFVSSAGCAASADVAACLRGEEASDLILAAGRGVGDNGGLAGSDFGPNVDGLVLERPPLEALTTGTHNHVPFVIGSNADETASLGVPVSMTLEQYEDRVHAILGQTVGDLVLDVYPASQYDSPRQAFIQVTTDAQFVCPVRTIARAASASQDEPVYRYFYTHRLAGMLGTTMGAAHGFELLFVFGGIVHLSAYTATTADLALADTIGGYWSRFAATGDPNGGGAVSWPRYVAATSGTDPYLELAADVVAGDGVRTAKCDFWESLGR